ncbi:MAG: flagellar basal body rod protein FlgC [Pseudomonadales bacterium]|jgi:flagellar basal-body rod protein FlgC
MSLTHIFDVAGTGMSAQTIRLNTVASNIANAESVSSSTGETYRARHPVFSVIKQQVDQDGFGGFASGFDSAAGYGVRVDGIIESQSELRQKYQPDHPQADENGFVYYPNVDVVAEMADMISASRAYQTNVEIMNTAKQMLQRVLTLGQ